jgi:hypothetical protein
MVQSFDIQPDPQGRLTLTRPGAPEQKDVRIRRAFPWSSPGRYVSVRDAEGKELLLIEDLAVLSEAQRRTIEAALEETSFVPKITRVNAVDVRFGYQQWRVSTDRGPAEFRVQEREDIRFLADGRFRIKDADGNVYELPRLPDLDEASRRAVEPLI